MSLDRKLWPRPAFAAGVVSLLSLAFAAPVLAAESCTAESGNSNVCVAITDTPDPVAPDGANGNQTFLSYETTVRNRGRNTVSHVGLTQTVPTSVVSVEPSAGSCSDSGATVSCSLGSLARNGAVTVQIVIDAPAQTGQVSTTASASFAERINDKPGTDPKLDTVDVAEPTTVSTTSGKTWVEPGVDAVVNSDPAGPYRGVAQVAGASTANRPEGFLASLTPITTGGPAFNCVLGQVSIDGGLEVCRNGGWLQADIPGTFDPPLQFHLRWNASLVSPLQTPENFVVFYAADDQAGTPKQVYRACGAIPCVRNAQREADGGWSVDLISDHNGYMR